MNAFRKLVLAPALLGLMSPLAASAQNLEMGTLDRYTQQQDIDRMRALEAQMGQVTSVSQFSDVQPTDWACLLYTSPSPRDQRGSRMPSSA